MNESQRVLIANQFRNTPLGFLRIKGNLCLNYSENDEIEIFLRKIILSAPLEEIKTNGKNHYFRCPEYNAILTINSNNFTVITAKQIKKTKPVSVVEGFPTQKNSQ